MNFDEIVENRRSPRVFTNNEVSEKQLEKILSSEVSHLLQKIDNLGNTKQMVFTICF